MKTLLGYSVAAQDGEMGKVHDFYFHDDTWVIRYLVVDTGHWLPGRQVLVTTGALGKANWAELTFPVGLTREQVRNSPEIDTDMPVSRQQEAALHNHFGWPFYWVEPGLGAWPPLGPPIPVPAAPNPSETPTEPKGDPHLRSVREVSGYHIHASDGEMGHVDDFIVDDARWVIRYMVVRATHWLPSKKVLISPQWLGEIRHWEREVQVTITQESLLHCPEFDPHEFVNREYEERLYDYYGRPGYWHESGHPRRGNRPGAKRAGARLPGGASR